MLTACCVMHFPWEQTREREHLAPVTHPALTPQSRSRSHSHTLSNAAAWAWTWTWNNFSLWMCECVSALGFVEGESVLRLDENENDDGRSRPASAALTLFLLYSPFLFVIAEWLSVSMCVPFHVVSSIMLAAFPSHFLPWWRAARTLMVTGRKWERVKGGEE